MALGLGSIDGTATSDHVVISPVSAVPAASTFALWFYWRGFDSVSQFPFILQNLADTPRPQIQFWNDVASGLGFRYRRIFSTTNGEWRPTVAPTQNVWHHIAYRHDGTTAAATIWLDGATVAVTETITPSGTIATSATSDSELLGGLSGAPRAFHGKMAELGLWDHVKPDDEVVGLAGGLSPRAYPRGRLAYHPMWQTGLDWQGGANTDNGVVAQPHPSAYYGMGGHAAIPPVTFPAARMTFGVEGISDGSTTISTTIGTQFGQVQVS